jgi:Ulp1 family protease
MEGISRLVSGCQSLISMKLNPGNYSTWLLTFDSLGGSHPAVFRALKFYLSKEAKHKKDIDVGDGPDIMQKKVPVSHILP